MRGRSGCTILLRSSLTMDVIRALTLLVIRDPVGREPYSASPRSVAATSGA